MFHTRKFALIQRLATKAVHTRVKASHHNVVVHAAKASKKYQDRNECVSDEFKVSMGKRVYVERT
jgi:hypothetical protein